MYTEAEYDLLFHKRVGQGRKLRDGFTREQAVRMFKRRDATREATDRLYADGTSVRVGIDRLVADGFTIEREGRWMHLSSTTSKNKPRLDSKVERDYIKVALNVGEFKRNY